MYFCSLDSNTNNIVFFYFLSSGFYQIDISAEKIAPVNNSWSFDSKDILLLRTFSTSDL